MTRHGNMLVGDTMSGKTSCWEILSDALNLLSDEEKKKLGKERADQAKHMGVKYEVINPKSINTDELYGYFDN